MRFQEFRVVREATGTLDAITQVANMANTLLDPFGSIGSIGGDDTNSSSPASEIGVPKQQTNIGSNAKGFKGAKGSVNPNEVSAYLKSKMDDNHRLGILANIQGESGFQPGVLGDHNTSGGFFQHHAERFSKMVNYVGDDWATDWKNQIDFALSEPAGREYLSTRFSSPEQATDWWVRKFERPASPTSASNERIKLLKNFA